MHLRGGKAQNILGRCLAHEGALSPLGKPDGRSPGINPPITGLLTPPFPHLRFNTPLGFDLFLSLVEGKGSLRKLLVIVMVSTVDDNVVGCLCVIDISNVGHPLLVCLPSAVYIWIEDDVLGPTKIELSTYPQVPFWVVRQKMASLVPVLLDLPACSRWFFKVPTKREIHLFFLLSFTFETTSTVFPSKFTRRALFPH